MKATELKSAASADSDDYPQTGFAERYRIAISAMSNPPSEAELARACGLKQASVWAWKTKAAWVRGDTLITLSEILGVRPKWLASGLGPMKDSTPIDPISHDPLSVTCKDDSELRLLAAYRASGPREKIILDNLAANILSHASAV